MHFEKMISTRKVPGFSRREQEAEDHFNEEENNAEELMRLEEEELEKEDFSEICSDITTEDEDYDEEYYYS